MAAAPDPAELMTIEGILRLNADLIRRVTAGELKESELKALNIAIGNQLRAINAARRANVRTDRSLSGPAEDAVLQFVNGLSPEVQEMVAKDVARKAREKNTGGEDKEQPHRAS